ncbi:MAG TPA: hypothetical protein VNK95_12770 [Caldilineaceae bacterium]|nr:hypothetical protein [Caldilineaceae bacterium]
MFVLVLPSSFAVALDLLSGFFPYITIAAVLIVFPVAAIVISRTALQELERVIEEVAPPTQPVTEPRGETG